MLVIIVSMKLLTMEPTLVQKLLGKNKNIVTCQQPNEDLQCIAMDWRVKISLLYT